MADGHDVGYDWYRLASSDEMLEQGDFLFNFPIPIPPPEIYDALEEDAEEINLEFDIKRFNLVVMTQSCDFQKMEDSESVILCPCEDFLVATENDVESAKKDKWAKLIRGQVIQAHLVNKCEIEHHEFDYQVINLRDIYNVPYGYVKEIASKIEQRVRLLPPYKEHLAQAFAKQFMRVGLPIDISREYPY